MAKKQATETATNLERVIVYRRPDTPEEKYDKHNHRASPAAGVSEKGEKHQQCQCYSCVKYRADHPMEEE